MGSTSTFLSLISLLSIALSGVHTTQTASTSEGEEMELRCSTKQMFQSCLFRAPDGQNHFMFAGSVIENGRIENAFYGLNELTNDYDCVMKITDVKDRDNGKWECSLVSAPSDSNPQQLTVTDYIDVLVAVPPKMLLLDIDGSTGLNNLQLDLESSSEGKSVACVAKEARPAPSFKWFIGDEELSATTEQQNEEAEDGSKGTYTEVMTYYPSRKHDGKALKCVIEHAGYTEAQKEAKENEASVILNVQYAPMKVDKKEFEFYSLTLGKSTNIPIHFYANPKPSNAESHWQIGNTTLEVGAETTDAEGRTTYKSSDFEEGTEKGLWMVSLTIVNLKESDVATEHKLVTSNGKGAIVEYPIKLKLEQGPAQDGPDKLPSSGNADSASLTAAVVVIIILIVVVVSIIAYARVKGLLCFAAKNSDALDEEKEAFDAEKGEAIVDSKGDSKPLAAEPTKPETPEKKPGSDVIIKDSSDNTTTNTKDNKDEDKKSNGAHTPV